MSHITFSIVTSRNAFTLIEMVFVIAAESVLIGLTTAVLVLALETKTKEERGEQARLAAPRLAEEFRSDVRAAEESRVEGNQLFLTLPEQKEIRYEIVMETHPHHERDNKLALQKTVLIDGKRGSGETFMLPQHTTAWFERGKDTHDGLIAFHIWTPPTNRYGVALADTPARDKLNGFTRTISDNNSIDPKFAANWRVIVGKTNSVAKIGE